MLELTYMADIERLIKDFQDSVKEVVELFYKKYNRKDLLCAWHEGIYSQTGKIGPTAKYSFHGVGLAVELNDKTIDFDFGEDDRIDGFDTWRLWKFALKQSIKNIIPNSS
jgi:hypothetical protein